MIPGYGASPGFNFATSNLMFFIMGLILFSSAVLMPQFLQTVLGYAAKKTGLVLSAGTLVLLLPCQRSANSRLDFRPYITALVEHDTRLSRELAMPVAEHGNHPGNQSHNHS